MKEGCERTDRLVETSTWRRALREARIRASTSFLDAGDAHAELGAAAVALLPEAAEVAGADLAAVAHREALALGGLEHEGLGNDAARVVAGDGGRLGGTRGGSRSLPTCELSDLELYVTKGEQGPLSSRDLEDERRALSSHSRGYLE